MYFYAGMLERSNRTASRAVGLVPTQVRTLFPALIKMPIDLTDLKKTIEKLEEENKKHSGDIELEDFTDVLITGSLNPNQIFSAMKDYFDNNHPSRMVVVCDNDGDSFYSTKIYIPKKDFGEK
jgi:hypothetical protein